MTIADKAPALATCVRLSLTLREPEVVLELNKYEDGTDREQFAVSALRIGVLALRQASGVIDANAIRTEGERLVGSVRELLTSNAATFLSSVASTLKSYFDPTEGHFPQRLDRLIKKDGELQSLLANHLDGDESVLAQTLSKQIGEGSPLLQLLAPEDSNGLVASLSKAVAETLDMQRTQILRQFSLDDKESALSRLVNEMTGTNGKLREDFAKDVERLHQEFSLDNESGALSRLVGRVEKAQRTISEQFSLNNKESALCRLVGLMESANSVIKDNLTLDNEQSPLYRLRRELTEIIQKMQESSTAFHEQVKITLESFKTRREEAARSTRHGVEFEEAVGRVLLTESQRSGDVFEETGAKTGVISYCKMGDHVITLGAESAVPGAKIVVEAKEDKSYDLAKALKEIEQARRNREAQAGVFVFSRDTAPRGLEHFLRHGKHIAVVWDRDDPATDIFLRVGLSVAKALVIRDQLSDIKNKSSVQAVKSALNAITSDVTVLEEIAKWATTVRRSGEKIGKKVGGLQKKLVKNLAILDKHLAAINSDNHDTATLVNS